MENDFDYFVEQFKKAITMIDEKYISVSMYQLPGKRYRERVYCYELYHQLRKLLDDDYEYMLDGELDKKAHPIIEKNIGAKIPDFVVHYRSYMEHNLVIIEVKSIKNIKDNISNLEKDVDKIIDFIEEAEYNYGIILIYSNGFDHLTDNIVKAFKKKTEEYSKKIFLLWHPEPEVEPVIIE